jgi:membrane protease YdiL (CAAX protease family)
MIRTVLAEFAAYCAAPRLIAPSPLRDGWARWAIMVALYCAGLATLAPVLGLWGRTFHLSAEGAFSGYSPLVLVPAVVLVFPLLEEALFRGWLTGRPRALWLVAMAVAGAGLLGAVALHRQETAASLGVVATVPAALSGWFVLRRRTDPPRWFARAFGAWFYLSVMVFGLMHMANYRTLAWSVLPMVLPQIWAGLVFGYLRMRQGLVASALAHAAGNAATLAAALLIGG